MIDHQSRLVHLHPAVFYRSMGDVVVLYHTGQQSIYSFSPTAVDVLGCFEEPSSIENALAKLEGIYDVEDANEFRASIMSFIEELLQKEILMPEHQQRQISDDLERQLSSHHATPSQLRSVTFELTYLCNERCRHCYIAKEDLPELETAKILSVLDELAEMGVFEITFTGGEVFTRKDAFEILSYAYSKHFVMDIFTNGTGLSGDDIIRLKALWPRSVHFSVYSHIPAKHDAVTRVPGSFEKTFAVAKACALIGIPVNIKSPILDETADDVQGLVHLANSIGASIELGTNITPKKNGDMAPIGMAITDSGKKSAVFSCIQKNIEHVEIEPAKPVDKARLCGAGLHSISIDPYGNVFPCVMLRLKLGSLRHDALHHIWNHSEALLEWRQKNWRELKRGCENCCLADQCIFCPGEALMRKGDPLAMYEEACQATRDAASREEGGEKNAS